MNFVKNSEINWLIDEKHDMKAGVHELLPANLSADVIFASIEPGHCLPKHWHVRPLDVDGSDSGYESFFFYQGAHIILLLKDEEIEIDEVEPFTLTFFSGESEMHGIKNLADKAVTFQVLTAPKFDNNEERY